MGDAEDGPARLVVQARDFPAVRQDDLLHHGQTEAGTFLVGGEVGLEDFAPVPGRHARSVIAHFQSRHGRTGAADEDLDG